jgi:hypothetical protein
VRTVTFYSYKGGTGRTLLLAHTARFLASAGMRVVMIDMDMEAPGLPYKFALNSDRELWPTGGGLVEHLAAYVRGEIQQVNAPALARPIEIPDLEHHPTRTGAIYMIAAGDAPSVDYVRALSGTDWHSFYWGEPGTDGQPAAGGWREVFETLKAQIQDDLHADYLLIDSRTGLADISGVCLNALPDVIVAMTLHRSETIDGMSWALKRACEAAEREARPLTIIKVIARVSSRQPEPDVSGIHDDLPDGPLVYLHVDRELEIRERPLFPSDDITLRESPLLRDYLRFFRLLDRDCFERSHVSRVASLLEHNDAERRDQPAPAVSSGFSDGRVTQRVRARGELRVARSQLPNARVFEMFGSAITDGIAERLRLVGHREQPTPSEIIYDALGGQIRDGVMDFFTDPYPLTDLRQESAEIVQFGVLETYLLVWPKRARKPQALPTAPIGVEGTLEPWLTEASTAGRNNQLEIACLGPEARSESYRFLWRYGAALHNPHEGGLARWLLEESPNTRVALVDRALFARIRRDQRQEIEVQHVQFSKPRPVGFVLPRDDRDWRRLVVDVLALLLQTRFGPPAWEEIQKELQQGLGIKVDGWSQFCRYLAMDMTVARAGTWLQDADARIAQRQR